MFDTHPTIQTPKDESLVELARQLAERAGELRSPQDWPGKQLDLCGRYGVHRWFIEPEYGGYGWSGPDIARGYFALASACLTTTFVITQRVAACRRIASSSNDEIKTRLLPPLAAGETFATVGVSHLTTSRRHLGRPVLTAEAVSGDWQLNGFCPWITGASAARTLVVGATLDDGREILIAVPNPSPGLTIDPPLELVGLSASQTGRVRFDQVRVAGANLLAGPREQVMRIGAGGGTGGLQTSTLALGLAGAAVEFLRDQAQDRDELYGTWESLNQQLTALQQTLIDASSGISDISNETLRTEANSLVLRATQAALVAAKGAGYIEGHPVGRWCREALFFLVWSCPQSVLQANLCELAGVDL